jgi:hypothetical protein
MDGIGLVEHGRIHPRLHHPSHAHAHGHRDADCLKQSPAFTTVPAASASPLSSASTTPVAVVLIPITANVTSSFDSRQMAFNITAPATSTPLCTHHAGPLRLALTSTSACGVVRNGISVVVTQPGVTVVSQFSTKTGNLLSRRI